MFIIYVLVGLEQVRLECEVLEKGSRNIKNQDSKELNSVTYFLTSFRCFFLSISP
jgi:hypothetical protein